MPDQLQELLNRLDALETKVANLTAQVTQLTGGSTPGNTSGSPVDPFWTKPTTWPYPTPQGKPLPAIPLTDPDSAEAQLPAIKKYALWAYNYQGRSIYRNDADGPFFDKAWAEVEKIKGMSESDYKGSRYAALEPNFAVFGTLTGLWPAVREQGDMSTSFDSMPGTFRDAPTIEAWAKYTAGIKGTQSGG